MAPFANQPTKELSAQERTATALEAIALYLFNIDISLRALAQSHSQPRFGPEYPNLVHTE